MGWAPQSLGISPTPSRQLQPRRWVKFTLHFSSTCSHGALTWAQPLCLCRHHGAPDGHQDWVSTIIPAEASSWQTSPLRDTVCRPKVKRDASWSRPSHRCGRETWRCLLREGWCPVTLSGDRGASCLRGITLRTLTSQNAHYEMPGFIKGAKSEGRGCSYARPWGLQPCSLQAGGQWGAAPSACFQIPTRGRQKRREKCQAEKSLGMRTRPRGQCQAPGGIRSGSLPTRGRPGILCIAQPPKAPPSPKTASCWGSWLPWCHRGHRWPTHRVSRSNLNIISVLLQISFCLGEIL